MPLTSHPVPTADEEIDEDEDFNIKVTQSPGFLCHISAEARIHLAPKTLWEQAIVHPDNAAIYRHMDRCTYRRVGATLNPSSSDGIRTVRVAHEASWRFLLFHGKFTTHLLVEEDHTNLIMKFGLVPSHGSRIVSKFKGEWRISPDPQGNPNSSISHLEQDLGLGLWMPPPIDGLMKSIAARQVRRIIEDLQAEAKKINAGRPTLPPYGPLKDKEIGEDEVVDASTETNDEKTKP